MGKLRQAPIRNCCGERHFGSVCPDGKIMCCFCFNRVEKNYLYVNKDNETLDVCKKCVEDELEFIKEWDKKRK